MAEYVKPVVFKVNNELYGVDINSVQSIEKQIQVVSVPNAVSYIRVNLQVTLLLLMLAVSKLRLKLMKLWK